jgi:hypothetical protein
MKDKEELKLLEIRLSSNIYFLEWILKNYSDLDLRRDKAEIENGEPERLSAIVADIEDIRQKLDNIIFSIK